MRALSLIVAALAVVAVLLLAARPDMNNGTPDDTVDTTTTVTAPITPTLPEPLTADVDTGAARGLAHQLTQPPPAPTTTTIPTEPCAQMSWYRQQAGLPARFDGIGYRESRCRNEDTVRTFCCHGWWQLWVSLHLQDHRLAAPYHACGVHSYHDINSDTHQDKTRGACATKALYDEMGYSPWAATA